MKIAVLFDGAGLARLGLEQAGHICYGFELDPWKHYLSTFVGSGNCTCIDVQQVDLSNYDAVWASPPCQWHSRARTQGEPISQFADDLLTWSLKLPHKILWVENVVSRYNGWGTKFNAAQFELKPRQNRNRIVGGTYIMPQVYRPYKRRYPDICPCVTATEYKGCASDKRRASRFYGRRLTLEECAYHQGFNIPKEWYNIPSKWTGTKAQWKYNLYEAIGNGVPCYMAEKFGVMYPWYCTAKLLSV